MIITGNAKKDGMKYHYKKDCKGRFCTIHNPSKHKMRAWPMNLRLDAWAFPLIERICEHGVGHPDPDSVAFLETISKVGAKGTWGTHGCDGCCHTDKTMLEMEAPHYKMEHAETHSEYVKGCPWCEYDNK